MEYNYAEIEKKWQKYWVEHKSGRAVTGSDKPKFYGLIEFPYPSGQGLHVGHTRPFTAMDVICRRKPTTFFSPSAMTRSACRRRTMPSRTMCIRPL